MTEKLFVGQIPKSMLEDQLRPIFIPFGNVVDLHVIRDHATKAHKGCIFVTFSTREETEACIYGLHNKITLPGMQSAIQVKYAGENPRAGGAFALAASQSAPSTSHKLFIGMVPKAYSEDDLKPLFTPFGEIKDMNVLRGPDGQSKGCAFILFKEVPSAIQAITTLNAKIKLEGATSNLVVQFASSSDKNRTQTSAAQAANLNAVNQAAQFLNGGLFLQQQNPFIDPYAGLASAAGSALGGYPSYMLQPPSSAASLSAATNAYYGFPSPAAPVPSGALGSNKEGPAGANLFIYHLPKDYSDASLLSMFSQFGTVLSCKVITDKETGENKGFGFVSYDSPESAQLAIHNTNGMQLPGGKRLKVSVKASNAAARPY